MDIIYRCFKCGWQKKEKELKEEIGLTCPNCGEPILIDMDNEEDDNIIASMIEEEEIAQMKDAIAQDGNDFVWQDIESIRNIHTRIEERRLFLKAGGIIPEKEIKI